MDAFLEQLGRFYEIVVYSDQLSMVSFSELSVHFYLQMCNLHETLLHVQYVDPVVDRLDPKGNIRHRLSRVATKYENGKHYRVCGILHAIVLVKELLCINPFAWLKYFINWFFKCMDTLNTCFWQVSPIHLCYIFLHTLANNLQCGKLMVA